MVLFHLIIVSVLFFERIHNLKHLYHGLELLYLLYDKVYAFSLNTHHTSCAKLWFSGVSREEIMRNGWTHRLFSAQIKMDNEKNSPHNGWFRYSQYWCISKCYILKGINNNIFKTTTKSRICWCFDELQYFTTPEIHSHSALKTLCLWKTLLKKLKLCLDKCTNTNS